MELIDRFLAKVTITESCWLWEAALYPDGYGEFGIHHSLSPVRAHRWAYEYFVGPIPTGLTIDHLCRIRRCVNPTHLEPVTQKENVLRGFGLTSINAHKIVCPAGHPLSGDNLYTRKSGDRSCRECRRQRDRLAYWRNQGLQTAKK